MNRGVTGGGRRRRFASLALLVALLAAPALAASRYDPRLRFRTIATPRFDIHFHQGEEAAARRLALIAEDVATTIEATLGAASGRVQVVLVNQSDLPNGWATPVPYNLIEISAAGPGGESAIGNTDDWLRLVFTHEYTHIVHLGRSNGWIGDLRRAFGRNPALFPNLTLPLWAVEGIATFEESAQTGRGRVNAGDFRQIVTRAASESRFEPLDRVGGGLDDWPGGNAHYAYGALFHRFLADRYGSDALRRLTDETGGRLPYLGPTAFQKVFGRSLGQLWSDFEADMRETPPAAPATATRVTHHGFTVSGPHFASNGRLYYSTVNPHGFPALMVLDPGATEPREVTTRYLGDRVALAGLLIVFDQMQVTANVGLQSDLYAFAPDTGRQTRLTHGSRAGDPDVSADGETVVFTTQRDDRRDLSIATLSASPTPSMGAFSVLVSAPDTEFASPQWSPDGRWIAAERHVRGALPEIVLVEVASRSLTVVAASPASRCVSPAWMPDGRRLLFASNRGGDPFRLFAVDIQTGVVNRLEGTGSSAESPDVSADGRTLVYVGYTTDGYDLFTMGLEAARWSPVERGAAPSVPPIAPATVAADRVYGPWATLAPRFWTPTVSSDNGETVAGAAIGGADALARHTYQADVEWASARARPDWHLAYVYDRWWPVVFVSAADDTDPFRRGDVRSTEVNAGVLLPWKRVRWAQSILGAFHAATDTIECALCDRPIDARAARRSIRAGYAFTSAKSYGYSISREEGWSLTATHEVIGRALGSDGNAASIVADLRGYRRVAPRNGVLAGRLATAQSWGDDAVRRDFSEIGDGPQPGGFRFGSDAIGLLRGFDDDVRGRHAVVANLDYRFPLMRIERGAGTLPWFVRSIHGALFVDAGHAWNESFRARDARVSLGAELSVDTILGFALPITLTSGAAWRRDGLNNRSGATIFGRIGRAF
jgi:hypothetical protein